MIMLIELKKHNNFGNLDQILFMITEVLSYEPKRTQDIEKFCFNNTLYYYFPAKGILSFLDFISAISRNGEEGIFLNEYGKELSNAVSKEKVLKLMTEKILGKIICENTYSDFWDIESIKYDNILNAYVIRNNDIPYKYSGMRNLLINLDFFSFSINVENLLVINEEYTDYLSKIMKQSRYLLSIEKFKEIQELKEKYGEEAEEFVKKYEKKRLNGHVLIDKINRISTIDVNAGYDIISFSSLKSATFDRFIEVKSYSKELGFYWSKNEVSVSKMKGSNYYLYLIDRDQLNQNDYQPNIICNPYDNVFNNENWSKEPQTWYFTFD